MSRHTAARASKNASAFLLVAAILLAVPSRTWRDDLQLRQFNPRGIPLHLLPDERVVESYRSIGYVASVTSQQSLDNLFCSMLDRDMTPMLRYVGEELERDMRLISEAFHAPSTSAFYAAVLKSDESRRLYHRVSRRQHACAELSFGKKTLTPEFARAIEANIADLELLGLAEWAGFDYAVYSTYFSSIAEHERALDCLRKSLACYVARGDMPLASQLAERVGQYHLDIGALGSAEEAFLEGLRYAEAAGDKLFLSRALYSLARLRASQGYFAEAESLLVRSVECGSAIADPTTEIAELLGLARLYIGFGEYSRSGYLVERAILQARNNLADPAIAANKNLAYNLQQSLAAAYSQQAEIQRGKGANDAAVATIRKALEYAAQTRDARLEAGLLRRLGDINAALGHRKDAARCYSRALGIAKSKHDARSEAECLSALGQLHLDGGQYEKAERYFAEALGRFPHEVRRMREADILHGMARAKIGRHEYAAAKRLCERAMATLQANLSGQGVEAAWRASREQLDAIRSDLLVLESEHFYDCDSLAFIAEKARRLRSSAPGASLGTLDDDVRRCLARREWIPENAIVIQHLVTPDRTIIIAMDSFGSTYRSIPVSREKLAEDVAALIRACAGASAGGAGAGTAVEAAENGARSLYRLLLEPISPLIASKDVLCFMPDDALRALPFGILTLPGPQPRFLIEKKRILFSPNLLALRSQSAVSPLVEGANRFRSQVLVGKPDISPLLRRLYPELVNLPLAQDEPAAARRLFPNAALFLERGATKEAVTAHIQGADLIHIATHTVRYPVYGGTSALLLASPTPGDDGENIAASLLTENEIAAMRFPGTKLAFISSCESAIGADAERVQGFGIGGAFLEAGAQSVVATLWPIEDRAAQQFATAFYEELLRGNGEPADALLRATRRFIAEDRSAGNALRRINVWGPFVVLGSFRESP